MILYYRSENPRSPSLLDKLDETLFVILDRNESLKLLWTLPDEGTLNACNDSFDGSFFVDRFVRGLLEYLGLEVFDELNCWPCWDWPGYAGELEPDAVGAWTSTLNLAVAVTFVTWELGVEHLDEFPEFCQWKKVSIE